MHRLKKEMDAIVFGWEGFHQYVCGRNVIVESHHMLPMLALLKTHLKNTIYKYFYSYLNNVVCH